MILSDKTIKTLIESGELGISPYRETNVQPASYDIALSDSFSVLSVNSYQEDWIIDPYKSKVKYSTFKSDDVVIPAHSFMLASTVEYFKLPKNLTAFVEGRSSIGRLGLFIQNAGWVDSGFEGEITLELFNATNVGIRLRPGMRIAQLVFAQMDQMPENVYNGKYQGQTGATGSSLYKDGGI